VSLAVDRILERRARSESRRPEATSLVVALLLHLLALAAVLILPRLTPPPPPLAFVPVQIIPAQALGVRRPATRPKAERPEPPKPEPAAAEEAPEPPQPKPEPKPEPPKPRPSQEEAPVLPEKPEKKPKPTSQSEMPRPAPPAPNTPGKKPLPKPQGEPGDEAGRKGAPTGKPEGTSAFGSQIAGLDNPDFKFGYYIDQLLSAIDSKWARPPLGNEVQAVISFRIQRDGSISDLQVARSSGYNSFDLAALRAVQNASPFAPLPRAYREDSLGVNLIVR
jgi:TonB family protein